MVSSLMLTFAAEKETNFTLMRRFTLLLFAFMAMFTAAKADWTPNDTVYTVIGKDSLYNQGQLKTLRTLEGNTVLTWLALDKDGLWTDPAFGYYLHLQVIDAQGNLRFNKDGIVVSKQPTPTYTTDYGVVLAANGDIVMAYWDTRSDTTRANTVGYLYRYTQEGQPVWDAQGIMFPVVSNKTRGHEIAPQLVVSGNNIYVGYNHVEYYNVKADSTNWEPNPWIENDTMPDSVLVEDGNFQLQRVNDDGTFAWTSNKIYDDNKSVWLMPSDNGDVIALIGRNDYTVEGEKLDAEGKSVWPEGVISVVTEALGSAYLPTPTMIEDGEGGVVLAYRIPTAWYGYVGMHHLTADGGVSPESFNPLETTDGDGSRPVMALRDGRLMLGWEYAYDSSNTFMRINLLDVDEGYLWTDSLKYGKNIDNSEQWGIVPVKVIAQNDGWVILYGNANSWNTANFMAVKVDDNGKQIWSKRINEPGCIMSDINVESDGKYAWIYFTSEQQYDDNWNLVPGPGGLRVLCVDISNEGNPAGINSNEINRNANANTYYNIGGMRLSKPAKGLNIVKDAQGKVSKIVRK